MSQEAATPSTRLVDARAASDQVTSRFPWGWRLRDPESIAASWRRQAVIVTLDGESTRLQARLDEHSCGGVCGDQGQRPVHDLFPRDRDVIVVGSIPGPVPALPGETETRRERLRESLRVYGAETTAATIVDRGHEWTEPALIAFELTGTDDHGAWLERVLGRARTFGFDHAVRIRDGQWQVLELSAPRFMVVSSDPYSITRDDESRCPMLRSPAVGEYCQMVGGPYGSAAIHAAAAWRDRRDDLVAAVGCRTCDGERYQFQGRVVSGGGPISLVETPLPSRWLAADDARLEYYSLGDREGA